MDARPESSPQSFPDVDALLRAATPRVWVTPAIAGLLVVCFVGSVLLGAHSGYTWPWVDPTGATKLYTLPAKARFDNGTPFVQP